MLAPTPSPKPAPTPAPTPASTPAPTPARTLVPPLRAPGNLAWDPRGSACRYVLPPTCSCVAPEPSGAVAPYKRMVLGLHLASGFARRGAGHCLCQTPLADICARALVVAHADVPRRRWGGASSSTCSGRWRGSRTMGKVPLAAADLDCASRRENPWGLERSTRSPSDSWT